MAGITSILFGQQHAKIGGITIDASISEDHSTDCEVTEFPVEAGAEITDHVQVKCPELTMEGMISDSPLGIAILSNTLNLVGSVGSMLGLMQKRSISSYKALTELQNKRVPFTVFTTLKKYDNMVIKSLRVKRDSEKGNALFFTAQLKQIRIVQSQTVANENLADSAKDTAGSTKDKGSQTPTEEPNTETTAADTATEQTSFWDKTKP